MIYFGKPHSSAFEEVKDTFEGSKRAEARRQLCAAVAATAEEALELELNEAERKRRKELKEIT